MYAELGVSVRPCFPGTVLRPAAVIAPFLLTCAAVTACDDVTAGPVTQGAASPSAVQSTQRSSREPATTSPELPRGGRRIFPTHQLVAYVGLPGAPALGPLDSNLDARADKLEKLSTAYAAGRVPLPAMELITVLAHDRPGPDGQYRSWIADTEIDRYLDVARRHKMLLLLAIQPGRADLLTEVKRYEKWLAMPDVGLAFDPEWAVGPGQVPGRVFGSTTGSELNAVASYLSGLVTRDDLPEKVFVFHQLSLRIVQNEKALRPHPGVVVVKSVDGIGHRTNKIETWRRLTSGLAPGVHAGFKLFYEEDTRHGALMTPAQVLALRPRPELVTYE